MQKEAAKRDPLFSPIKVFLSFLILFTTMKERGLCFLLVLAEPLSGDDMVGYLLKILWHSSIPGSKHGMDISFSMRDTSRGIMGSSMSENSALLLPSQWDQRHTVNIVIPFSFLVDPQVQQRLNQAWRSPVSFHSYMWGKEGMYDFGEDSYPWGGENRGRMEEEVAMFGGNGLWERASGSPFAQ